jgi:predicted negative regulator of RcsB-dependent stress response
LQQFQKSLSDINIAFQRNDANKGFLFNLKGVNFINLGETDKACQNFKKAVEIGDVDGQANFKKFCEKK